MFSKVKRKIGLKPIRSIYIFYWFLLAYIIAALIFWFISLYNQNVELSYFKLNTVVADETLKEEQIKKIESEKRRKTAQYAGEGITFLLLIIAGAIFVFRLVRRQLTLSQEQQNFMMAITHELKTPIAVTKLNLETLLRRQLDSEKQKRLIAGSLEEANRLNALCNNMLMLSQFNAGGYKLEKEVFDLSVLVAGAVREYERRFPERKFVFENGIPMLVYGDTFLLQLAVSNLLDNAVKYSDATEPVFVQLSKTEGNVNVEVVDRGPGIPDAEKKRVFEKHFRGAKGRTKGTGLGMYLTSRIVKYHHGTVTISDNPPHGCIFTINLKHYEKE